MHDQNSWRALNEIATYFKTDLQAIDTNDWDNVEDLVKKIIKSSRAGKSTKEMYDMETDGAADR